MSDDFVIELISNLEAGLKIQCIPFFRENINFKSPALIYEIIEESEQIGIDNKIHALNLELGLVLFATSYKDLRVRKSALRQILFNQTKKPIECKSEDEFNEKYKIYSCDYYLRYLL